MPLVFQQKITRSDVRSHRSTLYLFDDDELRKGMRHQAAAMRGEPNAHGIRTKRCQDMTPSAMWWDDDFNRVKTLIDEDFRPALEHVIAGGTVIVSADGLGTGRAGLIYRAPRIYAYITGWLDLLRAGGDARRVPVLPELA